MKKDALPRNVLILGWVSLLSDVSGEMIFPLLPVFLTQVMGANPFILGLIEGISDATSSFLKLISGRLSDKWRKKRFFVLLGYGLSSFTRPLMGFAQHWTMVLGIRFTDRVGKGIRTSPRDALIAVSIEPEKRGRAYGYHRMMDHWGAVFGSLLGAGLIGLFALDFRTVFLLGAVPAILAFIILTFVRDIKTPAPHESKAPIPWKGWQIPPRVKSYLVILFIFTLGNATDAFLLLKLQESGLAVALLPVAWAAFHVIKALSNGFFGRLSDKNGRTPLIFSGWVFYSLVCLLFSFPWSREMAVLLLIAFGFFYGLTEGPERALLTELGRQNIQGSVFGLYHAVMGLTLLPANLLFGFLWKLGGSSLAFKTSAALSLFSALLFALWAWRHKPAQDGH